MTKEPLFWIVAGGLVLYYFYAKSQAQTNSTLAGNTASGTIFGPAAGATTINPVFDPAL